jgi:glycosyltransferase involved in cell wall biosynthesis
VGVDGLNLEEGKHALISDNSKGLAEETIKLLKDPKRAEKIGRAGQEFVREHFDWKAIVKLHDAIYEKIIAK